MRAQERANARRTAQLSQNTASRMFECPYAKGLQCNQKDNMCDKGKFEPSCIMSILRCIDVAVESKNQGWIDEGIMIACHVLLHSGYLKTRYDAHSTTDIVDEVMGLIKKAKAKNRSWSEIGFEWASGSQP